jgi:prepilin-type N-terminal cleavage/methylation domain-containing protein
MMSPDETNLRFFSSRRAWNESKLGLLFSLKHKSLGFRAAEKGFTLVELLVVIVLTVAFSTIVLSFMIDFWRGTATLENDSETLVSRQNAGDRLRETLNAASQLISQNSISDTHANVPDPSDASSTHWLLIHAIPGNTPMPASGSATPLFYFNAPSVDSSKNFIMNGSQPYSDEFVLYLNGSSKQLFLRTLVNPSASGDRLKTSCPPAIATSSCPADTAIAGDITSVDTRYFSRSGTSINYTSITDPSTGAFIGPDFPVVEVVELTLHLKRTSTLHGGIDTTNETIVRVALRNG